ncbi:MAG: metal-dependent transcriptional regulator, partial [Bacteroidota bacterium]
LKAIFKIVEKTGKPASTNAISKEMQTSAASVTDMLKRLSDKEYIHYQPYRGVKLTDAGVRISTLLVRKHRLWEVFLVEKLHFSWDEVHEIAEQLEHIKSPQLVERLDSFLGQPKFDPHGDPIPDAEGNFTQRKQVLLSEMELGAKGTVVGVQEHSPAFLQYLDQLQMGLGAEVELLERFEFDESIQIRLNTTKEVMLSHKVSQNVFIQLS